MSVTPASELLVWYDAHQRVLPWRACAGQTPDPYHVWLAEIMLQQTTVASVKPYFEKFLRLFPTLEALAASPDETVMAAWAGLGYYSRARNLLKCAHQVMAEYDGQFPHDEAVLLALPGIGPCTAATIVAIAFNRPSAPVDGNIMRVLARLTGNQTALPALKAQIKALNQTLVPAERPGDFAQAMMDLGATLCTPKRPDCTVCPWSARCVAHAQGLTGVLPQRAPKKPRPERRGTVCWLENAKGEVLVSRRPDKGLLGGMVMFPSYGWDPHNDTQLASQLDNGWQLNGGWRKHSGEIVHIFTHFRLTLDVVAQTAPKGFYKPANHQWLHPRQFANAALPSVMRKVATLMRG